MLHIHSSNRVEILAARLGNLLSDPLEDPMAADVIMVQSHGLERWLSLELARTLGVSANIEFPFPAPFITELMVANTPGWDETRSALLDRETLIWTLMEVLPEVAQIPGGEPVARFLAPETNSADVRLFQLAEQLGYLLDGYQIYRPQILQRWLSHRVFEDEEWQALVWQAIIRRTGPYHRHELKSAFQRQLAKTPPGQLIGLPPRVCLFGLSSLAPLFVDSLNAISQHTDLHLFFLNPCQEYWGDILSRKQRARLKRGKKGATPDPWDQMELGLASEPDFENELLAYFGKAGRDFFDQLVDLEHSDHEEDFIAPEGKSALVALQSDILCLQEGYGEIDATAEETLPSLQLHRCHSRMREVEVLNDVLLDLFEKQPTLTPRDIIVMAPKIDDYSSNIHAVFGRPRSDDRFLPYDIADRTPRLSHTLSNAFLRLISLTETRWEVSEVLGILECTPIMQRFGLTEKGLDTLRHWIAESGARWARDASAKGAFDLPETYANTWQFGLDRLLLGYAMPSKGRETFEGVLPFDHVEGSDLETLGQFLTLWDQLKSMQDQLTGAHSPDRWAQFCRQLVRQFFAEDAAYERELQYLYEFFDSLEDSTQQASFAGAITLPVIRTYLEKKLSETRSSGGFFTGGITFCNLLPMRSIPFRVVVLLGMGAKDFPREDRQQSFDLMREKPVRGDRSRKEEDRYMFLEAMLAARDQFIILYTGQSVKDNSELSPSIFVNQLRDYLVRVYQFPPETYTFDHRLQPFSPAYSDRSHRLHTFAREYLETPRVTNETAPVPTEELEKVVTIDQLTHFLQHPVAAYYQHTFGLFKPSDAIDTLDVEPIALDGLRSWQLHQWLLELMEAEASPAKIKRLLNACGILPHGAHGESEVEHLVAEAKRFQASMQTFLNGPPLEPIDVDLQVGEWRLIGKLTEIYEDGLRQVRFGKIREKDRYALWVNHLVAQSLEECASNSSALLGQEAKTFGLQSYNTTHAAMHALVHLVECRERGLEQPLALFPKASMGFAKARKRRKDVQESSNAALKTWQGNAFTKGECLDYYHQLAFGGIPNPLDKAFMDLSDHLIRPILDNEEKVSAG